MSAAARRPDQGIHRDTRRQARLAAVQALYQVELGHATPDSVVMEFVEHRLDEEIDGLVIGKIDRTLFGELVKGVNGRRADFTDMIAGALSAGWHVDRMETLLRIILLCGTYELSDRPAIPARAVIHEYVELAKAFFDDREPSLVNGVLDRLAHLLRPEELGADPTAPGDDGA